MPTIVTARRKDETEVFVDCADTGALMEVSEFFTFFANGYKFMPAYKNKLWDGRVRLFNSRNNTLPYGLLFHLSEFCKTRGYEFQTDLVVPPVELIEVQKFLDSIPLHYNSKQIQARDYQVSAFQHGVSNRRAVLVSPTGSGKSLIIYQLIRWFLQKDAEKKVIVIVPTTSLVEQMYKDFEEYSSGDDSFAAAKDVHRIYSGKEKQNFEARVVVTTWQSAITLNRNWFLQFGCVIGDEAHQFKAASLTKIMGCLQNTWMRIGTTGTLDGTQINKLVLEGCFGPVYQVTTTQSLIASDTLAQLKIHVLVLKYPDLIKKGLGKMDYAAEIDFIVGYGARNNLIANLAIDQKGNTLVLFNYVEKHGKPLYDLIQKKLAGSQRKLFYVSGSVDTDERERIREITEKEKDAIIVASMGTFSVGVNIRNLHNLIMASPTKSQIRLLQSIGRGLRKSDDGRPTTVYDLADDLCWKKKKNYTHAHAVERINTYIREKFDYEIHEVPLP